MTLITQVPTLNSNEYVVHEVDAAIHLLNISFNSKQMQYKRTDFGGSNSILT